MDSRPPLPALNTASLTALILYDPRFDETVAKIKVPELRRVVRTVIGAFDSAKGFDLVAGGRKPQTLAIAGVLVCDPRLALDTLSRGELEALADEISGLLEATAGAELPRLRPPKEDKAEDLDDLIPPILKPTGPPDKP